MSTPVRRPRQHPMVELVDGYPRYIDPKMAPDTRRMTFIILNEIPRFRNIHVCPRGGYHLIRMDVTWISPEFSCLNCDLNHYVRQMTHRESEFLCNKYPEYKYRYEGNVDLSTVDLVARPRSPSSSTAAAPAPPHTTPAAPQPPTLPSYPPSSIRPSIRASRIETHHPIQASTAASAPVQTAAVHPPPPYTPPRLAQAGFTGSGHTSVDPIDLDSVPGDGSRSNPIDLVRDE
ncbi:hypothetical protein K435DRAFT_858615 [Dendrothele bispora CBS 962.96]|uniref:Uncharacterized protein n=1 Tax=Dendrothele bispora (strain CBS 962.96) TaxID=1314807 RepID=A0A4S8M2R5_DENBC|nr:hypothetical protein K435DRAFT_858615 [Dendrothele bispora CBS 962.96]